MLTAGRIEEYKEYSNFSDLNDFNKHIEMFLAVHKKDFTPTEFMLFRRLTKYCAKVAGVANASIRKILKGVQEKDFAFGASESTFQRMKRKAIKLGILEVKPVNRKNGSQSSNLWIFKRFQNNDTPRTEQEQAKPVVRKGKVFRRLTPLKSSIKSITNNQNNNNNKRKEVKLDYTYTHSYVPKKFVQAVSPFFDSAVTIEDFWKSVYLDTRTIKDKVDPQVITSTAVQAFKESVRSYKAGKVKTQLVGYFTGTFKKMMDKAYSEIPYSQFE